MKIYLAGPFFNQEAIQRLNKLLVAMEDAGHKVFAPMRDGVLCPKDADWQQRQKVFAIDCNAILDCNVIVANLDYPLPITQRLVLQKRMPDGPSREILIELPDSGTVFEMGLMYALLRGDRGCGLCPDSSDWQYKGIVGYSENPKLGLNLMLEQACIEIARNPEQLLQILNLIQENNWTALNQLTKHFREERVKKPLEEI